MNMLKKTGISFLVAVLSIMVSGCIVYDLPARYVLGDIVISDDTGTPMNRLFLRVPEEKLLAAVIPGHENAVVEWSVISGNENVLIFPTGNVALVKALVIGETRIRVKVTVDEDSKVTDFFINVNPVGVGDWFVQVFYEETEVFDTLIVPPGKEKTINLAASVSDVTFNYFKSSSVVDLNTASGDTFAIHALYGAGVGKSLITISAQKSNELVPLLKTFTVSVELEPEEGVLFKWDSGVIPMSASLIVGSPVNSGYKDITFRAMRNTVTVSNGEFHLTSGTDRILVIGCTSDIETNSGADGHVPGVFDLSRGTYRLTLDYLNPATPGSSYLLRFIINNNGTSQANSPLGTASTVRVYNTADQIINGLGIQDSYPGVSDKVEVNRTIITFTPSIRFATAGNYNTLTSSFITLLCQNTSSIIFTAIKLEEVN